MKQGRNSICSCGSGKKYKRCHGQFKGNEELTSYPRQLPPEIISQIKEHYSKQLMHKEKYGDVKEIISVEFNGQRVVAIGNKLNYSSEWRVFPDFLNHFLCDELGFEWGKRQLSLNVEDQNPVIHWRSSMIQSQINSGKNRSGLIGSSDGGSNAWVRLAYDLYLIRQNADLKGKILSRLKENVSFQGARFEVAVAAMMLASGYELTFSLETGPGKHPEFFAKNKINGLILAVEAKSKHRNGVMGFNGSSKDFTAEFFGIRKLLMNALNKETKEPLLVFIELNLSMPLSVSEEANRVASELKSMWDLVQEKDWPNGFPAVGVFFYNDCSPWYLNKELPIGKSPIWGLSFRAKNSRHEFEVESLLVRIGQGCLQRANIPLDFPK